MNLPNASQEQMRAMEKGVSKNMEKGTDFMPPLPQEFQTPVQEVVSEPSMEIELQTPDFHEEDEYDDSQEESVDEAPLTPQQMNFKKMRQELEAIRRERDEAIGYAKAFQQPKPQQQPAPEKEDDYSDIGLDDDALAEGKHIKQVMKEMRDMKRELHAYKAKSTEDTARIKLTTQFNDYDRVMTTENLETLEAANPELAEMIMKTPDTYKRAKLAYDMVKQFGIYKEQSHVQEKAQAQKNAAKPRPLASVSPQQGDSPLSKANAFANGDLSEDMKAQYRREMAQAMRGR